MRAHALVLLVVVVLVTPATPGKGAPRASAIADQAVSAAAAQEQTFSELASQDEAQSATAVLDPGQQLVRRGEYARAEQFYADTAAQATELAPRALLLAARAAMADGDTDAAERILQQLLEAYPASDQIPGA